ncbi:MAG: Fic family protein [Oligoflexales bacterium]|nr:Fic family protein [Oligoflexales bacterium]
MANKYRDDAYCVRKFWTKKIDFEAPPSQDIAREMDRYIDWYNQSLHHKPKLTGPVRAALAHLHFECIHPFEDGNGRVGRAFAEKALSEDLGKPVLLSLSSTINKNKKQYYEALTTASRPQINITPWIEYFVKTVHQSQLDAKEQVNFVLQKAKFWQRHQDFLNTRQEKVLARIFKEGPAGFVGGINAQKYMKIAACSKASATRDLAELLERACLYQLPGGGRNTSYALLLL